MNSERDGANSGRYRFRKAGLLDLPVIFELIHEGAKSGGFSDFLIFSRGQVFLFKKLFMEIFPWPSFIFRKNHDRHYYIFMLDDQTIGFVALEDIRSDGPVERQITECAISEPFRGHQHGWHMVSLIVAQAPEIRKFSAICNRLAIAMKTVLVKHNFKMQKSIKVSGGSPLAYYLLSRDSAASKAKR